MSTDCLSFLFKLGGVCSSSYVRSHVYLVTKETIFGHKESYGLPWWLSGKESTCQRRRWGISPWVRKISWRWKWQSTPVFLPRKSHGQRSLASYGPWGRKELGMTEVTEHTLVHGSSIFWRTVILFSIMVSLTYVPTTSTQGLPFLLILTNTCCYLSFWWQSFW